MMKHSEEFKQEAVRIALTSGLGRERIASDLGIGKPLQVHRYKHRRLHRCHLEISADHRKAVFTEAIRIFIVRLRL